MNSYKATSARGYALFGTDVFDAEWTATEEWDFVSSGHVEIAPRPYKVLSDNFDAGEQGATVHLALLVEVETALIQGGHIERVVKPTKRKG